MVTQFFKRFLRSETGALNLGAGVIGAAGLTLGAAVGGVVLIGEGDLHGDIAAAQTVQTAPQQPAAPDRHLHRVRYLQPLAERRSTECRPAYEGGPRVCGTTVTVQCDLWEMSDGSHRPICEPI